MDTWESTCITFRSQPAAPRCRAQRSVRLTSPAIGLCVRWAQRPSWRPASGPDCHADSSFASAPRYSRWLSGDYLRRSPQRCREAAVLKERSEESRSGARRRTTTTTRSTSLERGSEGSEASEEAMGTMRWADASPLPTRSSSLQNWQHWRHRRHSQGGAASLILGVGSWSRRTSSRTRPRSNKRKFCGEEIRGEIESIINFSFMEKRVIKKIILGVGVDSKKDGC